MKLNTAAPPEAFAELESGLIVPSDYVTIPKPMPKAMDLFAGCGGMSLGFHQAGWHVVAASEYWDVAVHTYLVNLGSPDTVMHYATEEDHRRWDAYVKKHKVKTEEFGSAWIKDEDAAPCEHFFFGDIRQIKGSDVLDALEMEPGELDCIAGGPPCQGFSTAGKRQIMDPRNSLVFEFCRMIIEVNPKTMVFENVPGILNMVTPEGVNVVDAICLYLANGGYSTFDALKRSLAGMPEARGAVRRTGRAVEKEDAPKKPKPKKSKDAQGELFK